MSATLLLAAVFGTLLLLVILRMPVFLALIGSGLLGILLIDGPQNIGHTVMRLLYDQPSRVILAVLPMFIVMGVFAKNSRVSDQLFDLAGRLTRKFRANLAIATVLAGAGFGAISGSSTAAAAALGPMSIRAMREAGYYPAFAASVVGASGTLGILIPPSILLVLYGIASGESIGALLIAGIIPGLLTAVVYMVGISIVARVRPEWAGLTVEALAAAKRNDTTKPLGRDSLYGMLRVLALFGVVVGGIYSGLLTVSESAAYGALVAVIFHAYDRIKHIGFHDWKASFRQSCAESLNMTAMVFAILIGAAFISYVIVISRLPADFSEWAIGLDIPPWLLLVLFLAFLFPLGMILDSTAIVLICVPVMHPVMASLGFDGIWFAILFVKLLEIGLITPPVGINAFVVAGMVKDVKLERIFLVLAIFIPMELFTVSLIFFFPEIVTYLPDLMMSK